MGRVFMQVRWPSESSLTSRLPRYLRPLQATNEFRAGTNLIDPVLVGMERPFNRISIPFCEGFSSILSEPAMRELPCRLEDA
jgi:hypothetical protein